MHSTLLRQLNRLIGVRDEAHLQQLLAETADLAARDSAPEHLSQMLSGLGELLQRVSTTYAQHERDLTLRNRSLDLSSGELTAANTRLQAELIAREKALHRLHETARSLHEETGSTDAPVEGDDLDSLIETVAQLVQSRRDSQQEVHAAKAALENQKFALDQHAIVSIANCRGDILYANDKFCEITGYAPAELNGANHRILNSGSHPPEFFVSMWQTISSGRVWRGEICNRAKDGRLYWVAATIVPFLDEQGQPWQYIAIRTDISARKEREREALLAKESAEAANRAKSEFLANMSHEIRTPMNGILGMTELALETNLSPEQREYLDLAKSSTEDLLAIIDDILDFSKIEAGKMRIENTEFEIRQVVAAAVKSLAAKAQGKKLDLTCQVAPEVPALVVGDPGRLRQILINLVHNAIKFTALGEIVVRVDVLQRNADGMLVHFSVSDTGIGISKEKQSVIFEAFSQEDTSTTRKYGGTGLGLTISARLAALMDGSIWLESEPGQGSMFHFTLQLASAATSGERPAESAGQGRSFSLVPMDILVAEDSETNQKVVLSMLRKWGHRPALACNGREALQKLRAQPYDLVLMDMHMPVMDGLEATRQFRSQETGAHTPIIALTANAMAGDREICLASGMDDYLSKPILAGDLLAMLNRHSPRPAGGNRFDYAAALAGEDREIVEIVAQPFLENFPVDLQKMRKACAGGDLSALQMTAHSLKGTCAIFGATPLVEIADRLEKSRPAGDHALDAHGLIDAMEIDFRLLAVALGPFNGAAECLETV